MTMLPTNGPTRSLPVPMLQFTLDGGVVLPVRDAPDSMLAGLDDYDDAIGALDAALVDRDTAAARFDEADRKSRVAAERCRRARLAVQVRLAHGDGEGR